ncbi:MAG: DoxX family protein [Deltaproteobacteria bacterium]|nr:MAG: DoxX family protein [Deltaproteobacteria bacterium]
MFSSLLKTDRNNISLLVIRLALGIVMFPHGAQKVLGWFGGHGFSGTYAFFTAKMGLPGIVAFLVIVSEFFGSLGLIAGFLTRLSALGIASVMTGAIVTVHAKHGFFMNWFGNKAGEGFEFHILALGMAVALIIGGGGSLSVDGAIGKAKRL